jgi:NDP-sugar pyrophosphorylase family protein
MKTAVILAGGLGTRLYPVTYEIPKPLIPVQGRTLTEHVIDILREHGITDVILAVGYKAQQIKEYFGDGDGFGVRITYIEEREPLGTGGWMHLLSQERVPREEFIVLNGDNLFDLDLHAMLARHKSEGALVTIGLTAVDDVEHYGVVEMQDHRILRFVEKPSRDEAPSHLISSGYYIFSPEVFSIIPPQRSFMFERDLFPRIASFGRLCGFVSDAQWFDTGTFERWEKVIKEWRRPRV